MHPIALKAEASRELWPTVPFEGFVSAAAIVLAAELTQAGIT